MIRVTHIVNDLDTGGAQTLLIGLAEQLSAHVDMSVICLSGRGVLSSRLERVSTVRHLGFSRSSINVLGLIRKVRRAIDDLQPDIVHSHLLQSDLAAILAVQRPTVTITTVHSTGYSAADPFKTRILARLIARIANRFHLVVACGSGALHFIEAQRYRSEEVIVIDNGTQISDLSEFTVPPSTTVLSLSRWHPMKDHRTLFRSISLLRRTFPAVRLVLAGSGMELGNAELATALEEHELTDCTEVLGAVDGVQALLQQASCLVISSEYGEALPMAGLEALAAGVPVITTNLGDCHRLTVHPWQLATPGAHEEIYSSLRVLLSLDEEKSKALRSASRQIAQTHFSVERCATDYLAAYRRTLSATSTPGSH